MRVRPDLARATVRFSVGKFSTEPEIDAALERLPAIFDRLAVA
jgi:cysteine sulfinate desulfinase/cysteine desulfurase-like protein